MSRWIDLSGKTILVTGASQGIGEAIAVSCARAGANLVLTSRSLENLEGTRSIAEAEGVRVLLVAGDLCDAAHLDNLFRLAFSEFKGLDGLVNNAGALCDGVIGMFRLDEMEMALRLNLLSVLDCTQRASRIMRRKGGGSIVNLSSIMGVSGAPGQFVYASAKAGVLGMTRAASKELASAGIRVNAIAPGVIETPMLSNLTHEQRQEKIRQISMGRLGNPAEVANLALFLLSDLSSYITGQVIGVDGGQMA